MNRRKSREAAFLILFEQSFRGGELREIAELARECRELEFDDEALQLAEGVSSHQAELDAEIGRYLKNWTLDRISRVALVLLRCSVYEFWLSKTVPQEISINEAVELAKKYTTPEDVAFINGILGSVSRGAQ